MSGEDFGGTIKLRDATGRNLSLRGNFVCYPSGTSAEFITDQNGSADRVITPTTPRAEVTLVDKRVDLATILSGDRQDITIAEEHTGVVHLFTNAFYTGEVSTNRLNGEVSGVGIAGDSYQRLG